TMQGKAMPEAWPGGGKAMKKSLLAAMLALLISAPLAHAAAGSMMLGIYGGAHKPTGDYSDVAKTGFLGAAVWDYEFNDTWAAGLDASYNQTKLDLDKLGAPAGTTTDKNKVSILQGGAHVTFLIPTQGKVLPYITAGGGMYRVKTEFAVTGDTDPADA